VSDDEAVRTFRGDTVDGLGRARIGPAQPDEHDFWLRARRDLV
jgi:hypothetical protein